MSEPRQERFTMAQCQEAQQQRWQVEQPLAWEVRPSQEPLLKRAECQATQQQAWRAAQPQPRVALLDQGPLLTATEHRARQCPPWQMGQQQAWAPVSHGTQPMQPMHAPPHAGGQQAKPYTWQELADLDMRRQH